MHSVKNLTKTVLAYLLYYSGTLKYLCKRKLENKLVVLMYHRVLNDIETKNSFSNSGIIVNSRTFEKQISYLTSNFNPIDIDEVISLIDSKNPFQNCSCLITFDDGWNDNYQNASPILKIYNAPALIFLPTDFISTTNLFWQEKLTGYIIKICRHEKELPEILVRHKLVHIFGKNGNALRNEIGVFTGSLKSLSNQEIDSIIADFSSFVEKAGYSQEDCVDSYISWDQAVDMSKGTIKFGSHAISHRLLTKLSEAELNNELVMSKKIIEEKLQTRIRSIAYPNGNYNDNVARSAQLAGYKVAFTTESGYFDVNDDTYRIKRINIHQAATANIPLFLCRILGIF